MATTYTQRVVVTIPASQRDAANALLEQAGFGPNTFCVPLIPTTRSPKEPPPSHYGADWQLTPAQWTQVKAVLAGTGYQYRTRDHFDPKAARPTAASAFGQMGVQQLPEGES